LAWGSRGTSAEIAGVTWELVEVASGGRGKAPRSKTALEKGTSLPLVLGARQIFAVRGAPEARAIGQDLPAAW
jgi:hypothetical protein